MDLPQDVLMFRIRKTVLQMLKDRGYAVAKKRLNQTMAEFKENYNGQRSSQNQLYVKSDAAAMDDSQSKLLLFFHDDEKLNVESLNSYCLLMLDNKVDHAIIVIKGSTQISKKVSPSFHYALYQLFSPTLTAHFF